MKKTEREREKERGANLQIYNDCPAEWCKYEYLSLGPEKDTKGSSRPNKTKILKKKKSKKH